MKRAFDHCADDYAHFRPDYPLAILGVLAHLADDHSAKIALDVGAGTGIFSKALACSGWTVIALEPSPAMLQHVDVEPRRGASRPLAALCAKAELTGLGRASVDMVAAAQAFHWFNPPLALAEFSRILKPGGILALCWNNRDTKRSRFVERYEDLIKRYNPSYERDYRRQDWAGKIATCGDFEPATYHCFEHDWSVPAEGLVGFSRSVSYIRNVLSQEQRRLFEDDLRELAKQEFGKQECRIPLRADLWTTRKKSGRVEV